MATDSPGTEVDFANLSGPVLVLGGAGYIGSHTVRVLDRLGIPVVVFDDFSTGHSQAVNVPVVEASLADRKALARTFDEWQPRAVMHFAARCYVGESVSDPSTYYRENVIHALSLIHI